MMWLQTIASVGLLAASATQATPIKHQQTYCQPKVVTSFEQQAIFHKFVQQFYVEKNISAAFESVQENYIQHNPFVGQGAEAAFQYLSQVIPGFNITLYHAGFDSGTGYLHFKVIGASAPVPTAIVDIYRMNGSCVIEHWDVIEALPANATNPLALFGLDP